MLLPHQRHVRIETPPDRNTTQLVFEFPKLYKKKNLDLVNGLGRPGWVGDASLAPD